MSAGCRRVVATRVAAPVAPSTTSAEPSVSKPDVVFGDEVMYSGLKGKAIRGVKQWPTKQEVFDAIPEHCFKRDTAKSMFYAFQSLALTLACGYAGTLIPATPIWAPAWALYAMVTGVSPQSILWEDSQ
jgi:hypothetical protein